MSKTDPFCAYCRGSDCICEMIVKLRRIEPELNELIRTSQEERGTHNARANRIEELKKEVADLRTALPYLPALLNDLCDALDDGPEGRDPGHVNAGLRRRVAEMTKRLGLTSSCKSGLEPEENSVPQPTTPPSNTAPRPVIRDLMAFSNGLVVATDGPGQQIPAASMRWPEELVATLRRRGWKFSPLAHLQMQDHGVAFKVDQLVDPCEACGSKLDFSGPRPVCISCWRERP